jgi:TolB protein
VELATGAVTRLTVGLEVWSQAAWSPDGRSLLFSARTNGVDEVYRVGADGTGLVRLTRGGEGMR